MTIKLTLSNLFGDILLVCFLWGVEENNEFGRLAVDLMTLFALLTFSSLLFQWIIF